jgi:hypothetical protein
LQWLNETTFETQCRRRQQSGNASGRSYDGPRNGLRIKLRTQISFPTPKQGSYHRNVERVMRRDDVGGMTSKTRHRQCTCLETLVIVVVEPSPPR